MFWTSTYSTGCLLYASHIQDKTHNLYSKIIINKNIFTSKGSLANILTLKRHHDNCVAALTNIFYTQILTYALLMKEANVFTFHFLWNKLTGSNISHVLLDTLLNCPPRVKRVIPVMQHILNSVTFQQIDVLV